MKQVEGNWGEHVKAKLVMEYSTDCYEYYIVTAAHYLFRFGATCSQVNIGPVHLDYLRRTGATDFD
jgi:hypothetical protein